MAALALALKPSYPRESLALAYKRRRPEGTLLWQLIEEHSPRFLAAAADGRYTSQHPLEKITVSRQDARKVVQQLIRRITDFHLVDNFRAIDRRELHLGSEQVRGGGDMTGLQVSSRSRLHGYTSNRERLWFLSDSLDAFRLKARMDASGNK